MHLFDSLPGNYMVFTHCGKEWRVDRGCPPVYPCPVCNTSIAAQKDAKCGQKAGPLTPEQGEKLKSVLNDISTGKISGMEYEGPDINF